MEKDRDLYQVECNLDSMTAELMAYVCERLLELGCKDVWQESILMKKNRTAIKLCAMVPESHLQPCLQTISIETNTGGLRYFPVQRAVAEKSFLQIDTPYGKVDMKGVQFQNMPRPRYTPEFESCRLLAIAQKRPLMEIYAAANLAMAKIVEQG